MRTSIQSTKTRPGADCGSDHELLIAKFRLKLKKVEKTTRPFRYDINQIPYDYTVEVRNRFKGLDPIECLMNYGRRFMTLYRRQESRLSPRKKKCKKARWLSEEALQIAVKRRDAKSKGEKERYTCLNDFPGGSDSKASVYNVGDLGSIPGLGNSLEKEMATHSSTLA